MVWLILLALLACCAFLEVTVLWKSEAEYRKRKDEKEVFNAK